MFKQDPRLQQQQKNLNQARLLEAEMNNVASEHAW